MIDFAFSSIPSLILLVPIDIARTRGRSWLLRKSKQPPRTKQSASGKRSTIVGQQYMRYLIGIPKNFALPDDFYIPPYFLECLNLPFVSLDIGFEFLGPIVNMGFRKGGSGTTRMSVPKAAVDKHGQSLMREYDIGRARQ